MVSPIEIAEIAQTWAGKNFTANGCGTLAAFLFHIGEKAIAEEIGRAWNALKGTGKNVWFWILTTHCGAES